MMGLGEKPDHDVCNCQNNYSSTRFQNNTVVPHQDMVPHKTDCMLLQVRGLIKKGAGRQFLNYVENLNCFS
jgi:hypothetical protein